MSRTRDLWSPALALKKSPILCFSRVEPGFSDGLSHLLQSLGIGFLACLILSDASLNSHYRLERNKKQSLKMSFTAVSKTSSTYD